MFILPDPTFKNKITKTKKKKIKSERTEIFNDTANTDTKLVYIYV